MSFVLEICCVSLSHTQSHLNAQLHTHTPVSISIKINKGCPPDPSYVNGLLPETTPAPTVVVSTCLTKAECKEASLAMGIEKFITGTFSTKGCFDKYNAGDGMRVAYWSEGGTNEEMLKSDLPGKQERITCGKSDESESAATTECELGPMANSSKSCGSNEFCMLKMGVCNTKIGIFIGVCSIKSEMCPMNYFPVREDVSPHFYLYQS